MDTYIILSTPPLPSHLHILGEVPTAPHEQGQAHAYTQTRTRASFLRTESLQKTLKAIYLESPEAPRGRQVRAP